MALGSASRNRKGDVACYELVGADAPLSCVTAPERRPLAPVGRGARRGFVISARADYGAFT